MTALGIATNDKTEAMVPSKSGQQVIQSQHLDYIQTVVFDVYGRRMATCSGDRLVRIWELAETGQWHAAASWQAHRGAVTDLCWAHPEFGSLLATAGSDCDAKIWEERTTNNTSGAAVTNTNLSGPAGVTSPTHMMNAGGAAAGTSGAAASRWITKAALTESRRAVSCLEFAPRHWGLQLAVGSADGSVRLYEAVDISNLTQWPLAATLQPFSDETGCTCLSWCNGRFEPPTLVVGGSSVAVYRYSETSRAWQSVWQVQGAVLDVAWAPNVGRRFHLIAAAAADGISIYKLARNERLTLESTDNHKSTGAAWRCQWNVTGTVLACSGDAGVVQLFKCPAGSDSFVCVATVQGDLSTIPQDMET